MWITQRMAQWNVSAFDCEPVNAVIRTCGQGSVGACPVDVYEPRCCWSERHAVIRARLGHRPSSPLSRMVASACCELWEQLGRTLWKVVEVSRLFIWE